MKVQYKQFTQKDSKALENIIRKTWGYDNFCSPKVAQRLARVYLSSCLIGQTQNLVATVNNVPAGIIIGKKSDTKKLNLIYKMKFIAAVISLYATKEGRAVTKVFAKIEEIDEKLLKESAVDYMGEICFFVVDKNFRSLGIGKTLFESMVYNMKNEGVKNFFLFTDTTCNYGFYEHFGLVRKGESREVLASNGEKREINFYIYEYSI